MRSIAHRGPDDAGMHQSPQCAMAMRRLAIIDLQTGQQPIYNEDRTLSITFNGEVYNFRELRSELISKGHQFSTQTDTEVILHLFEEHGTDAFKKLNGYFAFVLVDHQKDHVYFVRDHFGIKPLHYTITENEIIYGSEIKSILNHPKVSAVWNANAFD